MPVVNVKTAGSLSRDQKKKIAEAFTGVLEEVAGKNPKYTYVVFEEIEREDWAIAGKLLDE